MGYVQDIIILARYCGSKIALHLQNISRFQIRWVVKSLASLQKIFLLMAKAGNVVNGTDFFKEHRYFLRRTEKNSVWYRFSD